MVDLHHTSIMLKSVAEFMFICLILIPRPLDLARYFFVSFSSQQRISNQDAMVLNIVRFTDGDLF
jgi:hypothetical protein